MAWEDWQDKQKAAIWSSVLDLLEDEARRFSTDRRREAEFTVTRARWDTPSVELRWGVGGVQRSIHAIVKGEHWPLQVEFSGAVWEDRDRPAGRERRWNEVTISSRSFDDLAQLGESVRQDLEQAFVAVSDLTVFGGKATMIPPGGAPASRATSAD
jgi:hypothetical protein